MIQKLKQFRYLLFVLMAMIALVFTGCGQTKEQETTQELQLIQGEESREQPEEGGEGDSSQEESQELTVKEDGTYSTKDEVALYIHTYGHLPSNFISKTKARKAGWNSKEGNLDEVLPGMSIGGSHFNDYDQQLPAAEGRTWTECDINYQGGYRGAERIIFSNDGLIYYTKDHYETFTQLY